MTRKLFVRDEAALNAALFTSLPTFKAKYAEFEDVCDLETLYHSIRTDACKKQKRTFEELKAYVEKDGKNGEVIAEKVYTSEEAIIKVDGKKVAKLKGVEVKEKIATLSDTATEFDLYEEIKLLHEQGFDMPASIKKELDKKYSKEFDLKEVRKIHYKLLGK